MGQIGKISSRDLESLDHCDGDDQSGTLHNIGLSSEMVRYTRTLTRTLLNVQCHSVLCTALHSAQDHCVVVRLLLISNSHHQSDT